MLLNPSSLMTLLFTCLVIRIRAEGEVRLANGNDNFEGLVEVFYDGQWGTICDDAWDIADAHVVCRQLGLGYAVSAYGGGSFTKGTGPIVMDEVNCIGNEERLDQCSFRGWLVHDCIHQEDAGVRCSTEDGGLRLVGGSTLSEGRVEVFDSGAWGTVCDDNWDDRDAAVVCRELGFGYPATALDGAYFGEGTGKIVVSNIDCGGTERRLMYCDQKPGLVSNCEHSEDAGVRCSEAYSPPSNLCNSYDVRLVNGLTDSDGLVEVCYKGIWGKVCASSWTKEDAFTICQQFGYNVLEAFYRSNSTDVSSQIIENLSCEANERVLSNCDVLFGTPDDCSFNAAVRCSGVKCNYEKVQLNEGRSTYSGTVQVCLAGQTVNICGTFWGYDEALVVCRELGYSSVSSYSSVIADSDFGSDVRLVSCKGSEVSLSQCFFRSDPNCTQQATVRCSGRVSGGGGSEGTVGGSIGGAALAFLVVVGCIVMCLCGGTEEETTIIHRVRRF